MAVLPTFFSWGGHGKFLGGKSVNNIATSLQTNSHFYEEIVKFVSILNTLDFLGEEEKGARLNGTLITMAMEGFNMSLLAPDLKTFTSNKGTCHPYPCS